MPYPDAMSMSALDASMGSTREADQQRQVAAIMAHLTLLEEAMAGLREVEGMGWFLDTACHDAGNAIEVQIAQIQMMMP